jgi:excisionase family DNA binding protein
VTIVSLALPDDVLEQIAQRAADLVLERLGSMTTTSPYLTVREAAEYLRCSRQRIYDLRSSGRIARLSDGGRALVSRADLDALVNGDGRLA